MAPRSDITPLLPTMYFWRFFGILPFALASLRGPKVQIRTSLLSRTVSMALLFLVTAAHIVREIWALEDMERTMDIVRGTGLAFSILIILRIMWLSTFSCPFVEDILRCLAEVDLAVMQPPSDSQRGMRHVVMAGCIWTARFSATVWLFKMPMCDILLFPLWFVMLATEQMIVVLCSEVARRYRAINEVLHLMRPPVRPVSHRMTPNMHFEELRVDPYIESKMAWLEVPDKEDMPTDLTPSRVELLREAHTYLADAFDELNKKVGLFLLIDLAYLFIVLLSTSVSLLQHCIVKSSDEQGEMSFCVGYGLVIVDGLLRLTNVTTGLGSVGIEAERSAEAAARLLRRALDWDVLRELQIMGSQVRARKIAFWACGLFTVDRPLLFSVCGAVTSYLFILSQLK